MNPHVDVLIPTCGRPAALAVTLTSLCAQSFRQFRIMLSDQTAPGNALRAGEVQAAVRVLRAHGHVVETHRHLPPRGLAEHRHFLLQRARAPYALFLDDDLILEPDVIETLLRAITVDRCGFVGQAVIGLSYLDDVRHDGQDIEFWDGRVQPESVRPDSPAWRRHRLHNAANVHHVQRRLALPKGTWRTYRVAWIGGCVMYDTAKLRACGGFGFWRDLPVAHCGEDVLAQLRVMARYGGCGILPSGAYHQELPTTVRDRRVNAPRTLDIAPKEPPHAPR